MTQPQGYIPIKTPCQASPKITYFPVVKHLTCMCMHAPPPPPPPPPARFCQDQILGEILKIINTNDLVCLVHDTWTQYFV